MALFKLTEEAAEQAAKTEEVAMGTHVVEVAVEWRQIGYILGDLVLMIPDDEAQEQISDLLREPWMQSLDSVWHEMDAGRPTEGMKRWARAEAFEQWWRRLRAAPKLARYVPRAEVLAVQLGYPGPPLIPAPIFGHLPYKTTTSDNDVFYRCEPWPVSKRINQLNWTIDAGTYAMPASELQFVSSGFAAVGRFALKNLAPACFRWELQPIARSNIRCGASVPLYGQAGGGVEVCFDDKPMTRNRGPIANPLVLPVL